MGEETELYYMRARWYEPRTGRFLSEDPIGLAGGINAFAYAGNDPVNQRDPTGRYCVMETFTYVDEDGVEQTAEKMVCRNITGGDLGTIGRYLGGRAGAYAEALLSSLTGLHVVGGVRAGFYFTWHLNPNEALKYCPAALPNSDVGFRVRGIEMTVTYPVTGEPFGLLVTETGTADLSLHRGAVLPENWSRSNH